MGNEVDKLLVQGRKDEGIRGIFKVSVTPCKSLPRQHAPPTHMYSTHRGSRRHRELMQYPQARRGRKHARTHLPARVPADNCVALADADAHVLTVSTIASRSWTISHEFLWLVLKFVRPRVHRY